MAFVYFRDEGDLMRAPEPATTPETLAQMEIWDDVAKTWILLTDAESRSHAAWYGMRVPPNKVTKEQAA